MDYTVKQALAAVTTEVWRLVTQLILILSGDLNKHCADEI